MYCYILLFLGNIILINCYTYKSTHVGYLKSDNSLCLGECYFHNGLDQCIYDYSGDEAACKTTPNDTKIYKTIDNVECYSNCGRFKYSYDWCVTNENNDISWDYCNKAIALNGTETYRTNDKYRTCTDECAKYGETYYWCHTTKTWDYCDPNKRVIVFNYRTKDTVCANPCELYDGKIAYCYDTDDKWKKCFLNPNFNSVLDDISHNFKRNFIPGEYFKDGYKLCQTKNQNKRELLFTHPLNVADVAYYYEQNFPTVYVRDLDPNNLITDDRNPVISYTVLPTYSYFGDDQVNLPLVVRALITNNTLRNPGEREDFTREINNHYNSMHPNLNHVNHDERGHIVASRLGGPTETYNIFPQSRIHNHGRLSRWWYMESDLYNFIRARANRYIEYTAVLSYETDASNVLQYRPTAIALRIRLYNENGQLSDVNGNPITIATNVLENIYYTNDPDHSCIIEGDEVEDNFN